MARPLRLPLAAAAVIEPGAGNCAKGLALCRNLAATHFVGVDISLAYLRGAVARLRQALPGLDARAVGGDITAGVRLPADIPRQRRLVFYPGRPSATSADPPQAVALLAQMRALALDGGGLLIGIDLPKDRAVLEAAYDDAAGVTAAFNRNVLAHLNRPDRQRLCPAVLGATGRSSTPLRRA